MEVAGSHWDDISPKWREEQKKADEQRWIFSQRYLVFAGPSADTRARDLLEHWTKVVRRQLVPPNASAQELAYYNARREFVEAIHAEIEVAMNGPTNGPQPRTT